MAHKFHRLLLHNTQGVLANLCALSPQRIEIFAIAAVDCCLHSASNGGIAQASIHDS